MGERESVRPEEKSVYCANYKVKEFFLLIVSCHWVTVFMSTFSKSLQCHILTEVVYYCYICILLKTMIKEHMYPYADDI